MREGVTGLMMECWKIAASALFCVMFALVPLVAQDEAQDTQADAQTVAVDATDIFASDTSGETGAQGYPAAPKTSGGLWVFVKMVLALGVVVALMYAAFYFFKRQVPTVSGDDLFLRRVASISLGINKSVQVVTLMDQGFVVGVADNNVSLLGKVEDAALVKAMNLNYDRTVKQSHPKSFNDVLSIFLKKSGDKSIFSDLAPTQSPPSKTSGEGEDGSVKEDGAKGSEGEDE